MNNSTTTPNLYKAGLQFDHRYLEHRSYYMALHNTIPNVAWISPLAGERAFDAFRLRYSEDISEVLTYRWYKSPKKGYRFDRTIVRMKTAVTLEFDDDYCEILHDGRQLHLIDDYTGFFSRFMQRPKREPQEIKLIVRCDGGLALKAMEISRCRLDIDLYYENDFKEVDTLIRSRLSKNRDKGIILLHGLPGTGKTTYLRYLVGRIKKQVLFLSPSVAGNLMDPGFIELLIGNPNSVIIIEDAEQIIMDRRMDSSSSVTNLLNISDGLLADFLNVQLICTFNSPLTMVDSALMRKGRLIAKYEFGRLSPLKAQRLSEHFGFDTRIDRAMTLAEVANQAEHGFEPKEQQTIGFRRAVSDH